MSLVEWILKEHPFFKYFRHHLLSIISLKNVSSFDDLVIRSRLPVRTALLILDDLNRSKEVFIDGQAIFPALETVQKRQRDNFLGIMRPTWNRNSFSISNRYLELAKNREEPALLWGQRRLVPYSAIDRALYIISWLQKSSGSIVFHGDDDLVSPIVAALAPTWKIHVVDIDRTVLQVAETVAHQLGAEIKTFHLDLSNSLPDFQGAYDIAISDPFPSGDGSFERMFWQQASTMLKSGGTLITTIAPSHKPLSYSAGAFTQLDYSGFCLMDLQADYGKYEVFNFEFIPLEKQILAELEIFSHISHTKSLLAAQLITHQSKNSGGEIQKFDFTNWNLGAARHYLTIQAGVDSQISISNERGTSILNPPPKPDRGLRVDLIFPPDLPIPDNCSGDITIRIKSQIHVLTQKYGVIVKDDEVEELIRLSNTAEISRSQEAARLGLAIRAIESWGRWRFDE